MHMLSQLKDLCGGDFTTGMQKMMQDVNVSKELNSAFQEHRLRTEPQTSSGKSPRDYIFRRLLLN